MRLAFDLESNNLYHDTDRIHCIWAQDLDTGQEYDFGPNNVANFRELFDQATELCGHNIINFDLPVLKKLRGWEPKQSVNLVDTMILCRVVWPRDQLEVMDYAKLKKFPGMIPADKVGNHSLEAWGFRLGILKDTYTGGWESWSQDMHDYCRQDVVVTVALRKLLDSKELPEQCRVLETEFAKIISQMMIDGFRIDEKAAGSLYAELAGARDQLRSVLEKAVPPQEVTMKSPQYWTGHHPFNGEVRAETKKALKALGGRPPYTPGPPRVKRTPFSPSSRVQVYEYLLSLGWNPTERTPTGEPVVNETVLEGLAPAYPVCRDFAQFLLLQKRIGQLAEGKQAWLKLSRCGRIHGSVNTNGAVTGRCTHSEPNMAQVPSVATTNTGELVWGKAGNWDTDCRALFLPEPGWVLIGADASGLELRALAHYLGLFDGGEYAKVVCEGDVHTTNQAAFGLPPGKPGRSKAKNGIYAKIYGGGPEKVGETLGPLAPEHEAASKKVNIPARVRESMAKDGPVTPERMQNWRRGTYASDQILKNIKGFAELDQGVKKSAKLVKYLRGLDGRKLWVRSQHSALNTLLQSAGALIVKLATVYMVQILKEEGLILGQHYKLHAHIHDEVQASAPPDKAERVGKAFVQGLQKAEQTFKFRCPLTGEYKIGPSWAHTH